MKLTILATILALSTVQANAAACAFRFAEGPMDIGQGLSREGNVVPLYVAQIEVINKATGALTEIGVYNHQFENAFFAGAFAGRTDLACLTNCNDACFNGAAGWVVTQVGN